MVNNMSNLMLTQELRSQLVDRLNSMGILSLGMVPGAFIPVKVGDRICEAAFVLASRPDRDGRVPRPSRWFIADSATGELVFFSVCQVQDFVDAERYPLDGKVCILNGTPTQAVEHGRALLEAYDQVRSFAFADTLDAAQKQSLQRFVDAFDRGIAPDLKPYYRGLSPAFFRWMSEVN